MSTLEDKPIATPGGDSLKAVSHEHHDRIMPHVDALAALAEMIDGPDRQQFAERFEVECAFIVDQLVPHIEAIESTLYGELERLMGGRHSMQPMRDEHEQLHRLFQALCQHRGQIAAGTFDDAEAMALRRVLYRLYTLLKVHLAEEELYLGVIDRDLSPAEKEALARGIDHAGAQPV
jgi:hypothetical protein